MPDRVHAILVVRPEGRTPAANHLERTLAALSAQTRPVDALTIVLCGPDAELTRLAAESGAEGVITASAGTPFAAATALATPRLTGDAVWLLAQDTAPDPDALVRLAGALELSPPLVIAAPKLVDWDDRDIIRSLGVSMNRYGGTVELAAGELDQGQRDRDSDVLGSDVRGILVRRDAWAALGGLDPALGGADEGLDLGVRARLAGRLVAVVPSARVAVAGDGVAAMARGRRRARRRAFATRTAQLHRRLVYAPAPAVPLHWLSFLPLALWRTFAHLVTKMPYRVLPEWGATLLVMARPAAVARARRRIRSVRDVGWSRIAPLRVSRAEMRTRWQGDIGDPDAPVRSELHFFVGGGAWAVLGALAVSIALFAPLLAWPVLGGGALAPLRANVAQLWQDAAWGQRPLGLDAVGPADPFSAVVALVGTLSPGDPSRAFVALWVLALPLAVLGGWFAATRVTESSPLRIIAAVAWALAPTFVAALVEGRPAAVLAHLLLPWLFFAASVAHRSWAPAGAASVILAAVLACAPSLAPAAVVLWCAALVVVALVAGRGVARVVWLMIPSAVIFAPLVWSQVRAGNAWGLVADPGVPFAGAEVSADPIGRALLAAGFPTSDPGGWASLLGQPVWWVGLLVAPLAVLAVLSVLTPRWVAASGLIVIAVTGLATAFAAVGIAVSFRDSAAVSLWPGSGLSLAWVGLVGAAVVALDAGIPDRARVLRPIGGLAAVLALAVAVAPALAAQITDGGDRSVLTNGPVSTLPAFVAAEGRGSLAIGTLVLDPRSDGLRVQVVWGGSATLSGQSTIDATRTSADDQDRQLASLAVDLVSPSADDVVARLAERGIGFVLLESAPAAEGDVILGDRLGAATSLDQREMLDPVGATSRGDLWRVNTDITPRAPLDDHRAGLQRLVALGSLGVLLVALLLAVPTAASRRVARRTPRIVGPNPGGAR
ncbi:MULTISPECIES: glycosyltransferase [Microbacterium]|uniref:glycosyltransferase n=1 Tax=Microbacterium TaxID=33882 RepID=UPI00277E0D61|nr:MULTISPECIES: glycosyltransferase [Microbacterium]MDQ1083280.1 GT2 family glycosyltransferase [Microbacterium sp. SORGH_AS_0344]MDQ1171441.1 GT2 family glycosyltransferase [Microbacterium proteolyticum]